MAHIASTRHKLLNRNSSLARKFWDPLTPAQIEQLKALTVEFSISVAAGEIKLIDGNWYVTHSGLIRLAQRRRCKGIHVHPLPKLSRPSLSAWIFVSTVFKSRNCTGFVGYGDANPSNVSDRVRGAEMRVAETRAISYVRFAWNVSGMTSFVAPSYNATAGDASPAEQ